MILPPFPELPTDSPLHEVQQRLLSLRQTLERACQDLDDQIALLGGELHPPLVRPEKPSSRPQPTQAHREAAAEFTRRLFEADPVLPDPVPASDFSPAEPAPAETVAVETPARVIEATSTGELDPALERATLEELNSALSAAFEQISKNRIW